MANLAQRSCDREIDPSGRPEDDESAHWERLFG